MPGTACAPCRLQYLYHVRPGDEIRMTGPCGTVLLLPEDHMKRPIVCVCTGEVAWPLL